MAAAESRMRFKVYLDEGHRVAEIFVSAATQCKDIVHRLQRQIHATDCFLLEVWQGCERLVPDNESILTTLLEWGSDLEDVKFYLHRREETPAFTQALNGPALSHKVNGFKKEVPVSRDVLLGGSRISLDELKEFAARQQQEIITKERELKTKQIQLMEMKRKSQKRPQNPYLQQLTAKADEQGEKLTALRKVQDQVDSYKLSNSALAEELESVRSLFMEKEKELAIAVAKVESLTQQLDKQRQGWSQTSPSREKTHQQLELERLRKELMTRNELNHQQSVQIQAQKQLLAEKHKELFELDAQIDQHTEELRQKRSRNNFINHNHIHDKSSSLPSPPGELDFVEMDYSHLPNFTKRTNKSDAVDSSSSAPITSSSFRPRSRTSSKLETLLEVEEEISDGHSSSKSSTEDLTEGPGPPRMSRVTALKSRFEANAVENRAEHRRAVDRLLNGKTNFTKDTFTPGKILNNSPRRVDPEGVETPESPSPERPGYDNYVKEFLSNSRFETKPYDKDSKTKRDNRQQSSTVATHSLDVKHISIEPDFQSETPSLNSGRTTPSDEGDNSGLSSPSSLSSFSSASSNSASPKAAMFALTGVVKKAEKSTDAHGLVKYENANLDGRASPLEDCQEPHKAKNLEPLQVGPTEGSREGLDARGALGSELFPLHQIKTEGLPTRNENVDSIVRPTVLDFSRARTKFKHDGKTGKSRDVTRSNHGDNSDDGWQSNNVKEPTSKHVTPIKDTVKTGKIQLSRLRYQNVSADQLNQGIIGVSPTTLKRDDEDQAAKEHRKTESLLNGDRKETYINTNASRLSQDASGTIGSLQKNELSASTSKLPQPVSVPSFIQKKEVVTLSGPGSSNVTVPLRHTKKAAVFSTENKMRKPDPPSRLPAKCVAQTGEEVIFSSIEGSENMIATSGESKRKAQFSSKNNLLKDEQNTSSPRLQRNSVSTNSPTQTGDVLSSSSLPSVDLTTPIEESREKIELTMQDNIEKTEMNPSESKVLFCSPSMDGCIPNGEEVVSSASSTPSNVDKLFHRLGDEKDETDNAKVPDKDTHVKPSFGQSQLVPLTLKPISYRAKKLAAEQQGDVTSANQSHLVPVMSNSVSVRGQSSLTRITVTPSASFFSSKATDVPEMRSPVPTSKRPAFMNRDTGPSYPEVKELPMSNGPDKEIDQLNNGEKEIASSNGWIDNDKTDLTQHGQKPRNLAGSNDVKQVVSSFNIRLSSRSLRAAETKEDATRSQESSESIAKSSGLLVTASKAVGPRKINSSSGWLGSENDRVSFENGGPLSGNGGLNSESDRPRLVTDNLNSGSGKSLKIEAYSRTVLNKNTDKVKAGQVKLVQNQAADENKASTVQKEKTALKSSFILGEKSNGIEPVEGILVDNDSEMRGTTEEALTKKYSPGKAADVAEANSSGGRDAVAYLRQAIKSVSDQLPSDSMLKPAVLNKDTGLAPISQSSYPTISDQPPDINPLVSKTTEDTSPRYEVFSKESESVKEFPEESQGSLQKADRKKKARHVSLDPHAVLLDAAVEGELELVKQIVEEVDDPSKPNSDGITALHNAVCAGHDEVVKFLVQYGCDINSQDSHGWTALHCAAANNATDIVRFLVEHGACILAVTSLEKKTPLQCCERGQPGYLNCMSYLNDLQENFGINNNGRVRALYSYSADEQDELSFECSEELMVLKRGDATEREWWWAENMKGETGYIPRNLLGAPINQKEDSLIHRINYYPLDNAIGFPKTYPSDSDLSGGWRYLTFEQLGPGARFSKVPIINGPGKLSPFALKIEVSIVLHPT